MTKLSIEPVTRVEGHGKVTLSFDDSGKLDKVNFHVVEVRGFEKFLEGRYIEDAPVFTPRICGICQVSHNLASARAVDNVFGVKIPKTADMLRNLMQQASNVHSHALHFGMLASPDLMFPMTDDALKRNVLGVAAENMDVVKDAISMRKIGQTIIQKVGGRAIHPVTAVVGGQSKPLTEEERDELLKMSENLVDTAERTLVVGKQLLDGLKEQNLLDLGYFESYHMGMVNNGAQDIYEGKIRVVNPEGKIEYEYEPSEYLNYMSEGVRPYSYLKFPYLTEKGPVDGVYRVNTLSRLNVCDKMPTPIAQKYYEEFVKTFGKPAHHPMLFHYARLIELISSAELIRKFLEDDAIVGTDIRVEPTDLVGEGVGCLEAPRGTLVHHFKTDDKGIITDANLVVATVQNNPAMDIGVQKVAEKYIKTPEDAKPHVLNHMEMVIRAYDPCLSCATHTIDGKERMLSMDVYKGGKLIKRL
ncbi:F420-non-reducing hydrogenase large subunit [Methanococcus maripaludis]|uniref:F420-non-reducing hydrogenase large subunit n=1 Tax=Methanococcus maripaludis TaxID=39152 RepID=A0A7J9S9H8_METMI|nr:Ni/Fe hydrogenase subunit alpha [Methanococcus maripaludis]MBA2853878.1 F420-non-reducing hydrogenase large subunit [Methanococcus maripaludis]MBA2868758.1 F420-non-reducing hydrogenase large subunit [Methanococcus maripaludis]MBB6402553.1 F420-non-reducing hydrogenase large subunit [Methanococcus maripaludis]